MIARRRNSTGRSGVRGECRFFYPAGDPGAAAPRRTNRETRGLRWADLVQRLIDHGHRYPDILTYTLAQVRAFLSAIDATERTRLAAEFAVMLIATRGGSADIKQLQRDLCA